MSTNLNSLSVHALKFFGKIITTGTHELNNVLGVINENAGLMEDLGLIAKQGEPPDIDRWMLICRKIKEQVKRTRKIIGNLNSFAHSVDHIRTIVDLDTLLSLNVSLLTRILSEKMVKIELVPTEESVKLYTSSFLFINLISNCVLCTADHVDQYKKIIIRCKRDNDEIRIYFSGVLVDSSKFFLNEFNEIEQELLKELNIKMEFDIDQSSLLLITNVYKK